MKKKYNLKNKIINCENGERKVFFVEADNISLKKIVKKSIENFKEI